MRTDVGAIQALTVLLEHAGLEKELQLRLVGDRIVIGASWAPPSGWDPAVRIHPDEPRLLTARSYGLCWIGSEISSRRYRGASLRLKRPNVALDTWTLGQRTVDSALRSPGERPIP